MSDKNQEKVVLNEEVINTPNKSAEQIGSPENQKPPGEEVTAVINNKDHITSTKKLGPSSDLVEVKNNGASEVEGVSKICQNKYQRYQRYLT